MKYNMQSRFTAFFIAVILVFSAMSLKMAYLTIFSGELFSTREASFIYKKIEVKAPRGEIRDRHGRLLAGNRPSFNVQMLRNSSLKQKEQNDMILKTVTILRKNGEVLVDDFPIKVYQGNYYFTYDEQLRKWKERNNIDRNATAEQSFHIITNMLIEQGVLQVEQDDTAQEIQEKIIETGFYPPISVQKMKFVSDVKKEEWMQRNFPKDYESYMKKSAKEIFELLRIKYDIPTNLDEKSARDILVITDLLKSRSIYQYQPADIALDVKKSTVIQLEETSLDIPTVSIVVEPVRYYPYGKFASHILGYLGKMSDVEIKKYVKEQGYDLSEIIGKTGIERTFESKLRGKAGYQKVQVDSSNKLVKNLDFQDPIPGDTVYLSMDAELQQTVEQSLQKTLKCIQNGEYYKSSWGDSKMRDNNKVFNKAKSGATIVLDVKTGDVLAMASYPDYDPNKFVLGISQEEYEKLMPENINDPMAPKPLYNIATMMSVQPGSTFKMLTGLAGLENGLDPNYRIQDKGFIKIGNHSFGCWIWNSSNHSRTHGKESLADAIRDSCNYYFYCLSVGYDYSLDKPMNVNMNSQKILDYAIKFGLNEKTGVEIDETKGRVPEVGVERERKIIALREFLLKYMEGKFEDIHETDAEYGKRIEKIISWADENPSRGQLIKRLSELNVKSSQINAVTDRIKYDYFISMGGWKEGDAFNLAIGQGAHSYTPIQLARYISSIANKGVLNEVTLIDKTINSKKDGVEVNRKQGKEISLKDRDNLKYLTQGMVNVSDEGTSKNIFQNFPLTVASKTGTAQRSGKIPTIDEKNYYLSHLGSYGVNYSDVINLAEKLEKESETKEQEYQYIVKAILKLNKNLTKKDLDMYKDSYDEFAWFVSFAPAEKPEIAIVSVIVQGGHGGYAAPMARDIYAKYFQLKEPEISEGTHSNAILQEEPVWENKMEWVDELN